MRAISKLNDTTVVAACPMCGKKMQLAVPSNVIDDLCAGQVSVQNLLPENEYEPGEREFCISGYCPECQEMLFGAETKPTSRWHEYVSCAQAFKSMLYETE